MVLAGRAGLRSVSLMTGPEGAGAGGGTTGLPGGAGGLHSGPPHSPMRDCAAVRHLCGDVCLWRVLNVAFPGQKARTKTADQEALCEWDNHLHRVFLCAVLLVVNVKKRFFRFGTFLQHFGLKIKVCIQKSSSRFGKWIVFGLEKFSRQIGEKQDILLVSDQRRELGMKRIEPA